MIALIAVPLLAVALPTLLRGHNSQRDIDRLVAMEEWTRSLSGLLTAGASLEQALIASLRGAPAPIRPQISRLVARLRAHWRSEQAIAALGDELADPTGDIIAATLLLGARQRGFGLAAILSGLAESVSLDVRGRRQVEAEAAKPRATARWVTAITLAMLAALMASGSYFASYRSGIGQIILAGLLCSYLLILAWMRRIAAGPSPTRPLRLEPETHRISQHGSETDLTDSDLGIASPLRSTGAATSGLTARQPAVKPSDRDWAEAAKSRPGQSSPWPVRLNQHSLWIEQS
jgi:hypothetical protein